MSDATRSATLSGRVQNRLNLLGAGIRRLRTARFLLLILLSGVICLLLFGGLDFAWPLSPTTRGLFALGLLAAAIVAFVRNQLSLRSIGPFDSVIQVEQTHPELGQRLRTAWQHRAKNMTSSAAPRLVDALIEDTNARTEQMDFRDVVPRKQLLPVSALVLGAVVLALGILALIPESRITLGRLLLFPIHYSQIHFAPNQEPVMAGSSVTLQAEVTGRPVASVELWVRGQEGDATWQSIPMRPADAADDESAREPDGESAEVKWVHGKVVAELKDCQHDLQFKVIGGPVATSIYDLQVLQPLEQVSFGATVTPPPYTGLEPIETEETAFAVPEGSQVQLQLTLNRPAASAKLARVDRGAFAENSPLDLTVDGTTLLVKLPQVAESQQYEFVAESDDGISFQSERIRLRVDKDDKPTVRFRRPEEQMEATPTTEVALALDVADDYGLGKIGVEYQIGNGQKRVLWEQDLAGQQTSLQHVPVLFLEKHRLNHGDAVTYYAFAEDNRQRPRRASSELRFIDIRPYKREFQIVDGSCSGGGSCLSLEELIARQRQNLRRTFANVDDTQVRDELANRLGQTQQEIREATVEFTTGWESQFGAVPELHEAAAAMQQAEAMLRAKQLASGLLNEQAALNGLISARQNLRKFIKNCSGSGLSQCRSYDSQMAQKLRGPQRQEKPDSESPPSSIQPELRELAQKQREWSDALDLHASAGVQLDKKDAPPPANTQHQSQPKPLNELAKSQQACATGAQNLQQTMRRDGKSSELSQQRMDEIAERIQESLESLEQDRAADAARQARRAAELAEQLNEQLSGLHAADFSERLGVAEQIARRVTQGEQALSRQLQAADAADQNGNEPLADTQDALAEQVATLDEVLKFLEADASIDYPQMRRDLSSLQDQHPAQPLADEMHQTAEQIRQQQINQANKAAEGISRELAQIAGGLAEIRRQFLQPRLDELMAAEGLAAEILRELKGASDPAAQARLGSQIGELQQALRNLNVSVSETSAQAASGSRNPTSSEHAPSEGEFSTPGAPFWGHPTLGNHEGLSQIIQVLQAKIQDAILLSAQMDADQPVPPVYRRLVEEYYQSLSDDLR